MREDLSMLKISDIDYDKRTIKFIDKEFKFPEEFIERLRNYIEEVRNKKFNSDYLFARKYGKYTESPMSISAINTVISKGTIFINEILGDTDKQVNLEKIKGMLAKKMFEVGFALEEIIAITEISLSSLSKYIITDDILERTDVKELDKRHPYLEFFK